MRCQHCNEKLANHDLWCVKCGKQSTLISNELSAKKNLNETWSKYKVYRGSNFPVGIWAFLTGFLPLLVLIWVLNFALPAMSLWKFIVLHSIVWTLFIPVLFVPFKAVCKTDGYKIDIKDYFNSFKSYIRYLPLAFISVLFYVIIFVICQGDPILNLVWLVLVLYWVAIILPVPVIIERYNIGAFSALKISYKEAGDLRWNLFLMTIILFIADVLATLLLLIGIAITLPFTWFAIRDYVDQMIDYEVFATKV